MLQNWRVSLVLKENYLEILEGLCNELIKELDKPKEEQDHFLICARSLTKGNTSAFRKISKEEEKKELDAFIDVIYSYDFEKFTSFFFQDLGLHQKAIGDAYRWEIWLDDYFSSEYSYHAEDEMMSFLELICEPKKTFIETHVFEEDDNLPVRRLLVEGPSGMWKKIYPELIWTDCDCDE
jgi:hypothetical protein